MYRRIIASLLLIIWVWTSAPAQQNRSMQIDSLLTSLQNCRMSSDSIRVLYNILDLSRRADAPRIAKSIYRCATNAGEFRTQLDICRQMGNQFYTNDSIVKIILDEVATLPEGTERYETEVFIRLMNTTAHAARCNPDQLRDSLHVAIRALGEQEKSENKDINIYRRIEPLYRFCIFLGYVSKGDLLTDTYERIGKMVEQLPEYPGALRSKFYVSSSKAYAANQLYDKAFVTEKKILATIDSLQRRYEFESRPFRNYDANRYTAYRHILAAFPAMTAEEVQYYYDKLLELLDRNPELADDFNKKNFRPAIYYLIANERYAEAIPLLKKFLASGRESNYRQSMLKYLKQAAIATGDSATLLKAALDYNDLLEARAKEKVVERTREMQLIYEMNNLRQNNSRIKISSQQKHIDWQRKVLVAGIIAGVIMVVLIVVLWRFYQNARQLGSELKERNLELKNERDALKETRENLIEARDRAKMADYKKTDFINMMSHDAIGPVNTIVEYTGLMADCADSDSRAYLHRFADIIRMNSRLLMSLLNQALDVAAIENSVMEVIRENVNVADLCRVAVAAIKSGVNPGVEIIYKDNCEEGQTVMTDGSRVGQILNNLLSNAAKFTEEGRIVVESSVDRDNNRLIITVTDTGIGIPASKAETIFERFEKLDSDVEGYGLGLYISKLITKMLNGTLELDTTYYTGGARFIFTLPLV